MVNILKGEILIIKTELCEKGEKNCNGTSKVCKCVITQIFV